MLELVLLSTTGIVPLPREQATVLVVTTPLSTGQSIVISSRFTSAELIKLSLKDVKYLMLTVVP